MKDSFERFYAKILLFGEYSVICNSKGLSIPYTHFKGEMSFIHTDKYTDLDFAQRSNKHLRKFADYLRQLKAIDKLQTSLDINRFDEEIKQGLYFESSIPQGYGIGSSGALCAAVYARYTQNRIDNNGQLAESDILELKGIFAQLESFFHGTSSGLDPLNCYIKSPLLIQKGAIRKVGIPQSRDNGKSAIFLIDSGKPGKTGPLVNLFLKKCQQPEYKHKVEKNLIPLTDRIIELLIAGEHQEFYNALGELSNFQVKNFEPMIPPHLQNLWRKGLSDSDFYLKLCGSGGGGFLLGFTPNYPKVRHFFRKKGISPITVYRNKPENQEADSV